MRVLTSLLSYISTQKTPSVESNADPIPTSLEPAQLEQVSGGIPVIGGWEVDPAPTDLNAMNLD